MTITLEISREGGGGPAVIRLETGSAVFLCRISAYGNERVCEVPAMAAQELLLSLKEISIAPFAESMFMLGDSYTLRIEGSMTTASYAWGRGVGDGWKALDEIAGKLLALAREASGGVYL